MVLVQSISMERRRVTAPFLATAIRPRQIMSLQPGDVLDECVCVGPIFRFLVHSGAPKKPVAVECATAVVTERTQIERA